MCVGLAMKSCATIAFLLCIFSLCRAQVSLSTCGDEDSDVTCSFFFSKIDEAFRDETILYTLRNSFFPIKGATPTLFEIFTTIQVENIPGISCKDPKYLFGDRAVSQPPRISEVCTNNAYQCDRGKWTWEHQWSKTIIRHIIESEDLHLLQDTNFVAFVTSKFNTFDTSVFSEPERTDLTEADAAQNKSSSLASTGRASINFALLIDFLPCQPDDDILLNAWENILPWIELYAKNVESLENVQYSQDERGFAFREQSSRRKGLTLPLLTIIQILLNSAFALAVTYLIAKYHKELNEVKGKRYQVVASIYWSVVLLCFAGTTVIIVGNSYLYYALTIVSRQSDEAFSFRLANDITVTILAIIELLAALFTPHDPTFFIPHVLRVTATCNQYCLCCGSKTGLNLLRQFILSLAMWIIILFLQLAISSLLPIAIVTVVNPVPSLAFLSIMVALFFCLIVFVAYFMNAFEGNYIATHKLSQKERRSSVSLELVKRNPKIAGEWARNKLILVAQAFIFLVIFIIVALVVIIYLNFVRAGANANTVSGLLFSIIPSVALGGFAWVAKRHLFREFDEEEETTESEEGRGEDLEENIETNESFFQFGKFSIGPSTRRVTRKMSQYKQKVPNSASVRSTGSEYEVPASTTIEIDLAEPAKSSSGAPGEEVELKNAKIYKDDSEGSQDYPDCAVHKNHVSFGEIERQSF